MILNQATLATLLNRADIANYPPDYIAGVIADVQASIASYLLYDPVLQVVSGEEGTVELDSSGAYRGLYRLQTDVAPLIPGIASTVFSSLAVTYARSVQVTIPVNLTFVTMQHKNARVWLSPGALSFLVGVSVDLGGPFGALTALGYVASYVAGYATGFDDPTRANNVSYGAPAMPADITQAAVLLCRERLAMDDAANVNTTNAASGAVTYIRTANQEVKYQSSSSISTTSSGGLGFGTVLGQSAIRKLQRYRRTEIA